MKKIKKAVLIFGYGCNNNCQFCLNSNKRNIYSEKSTNELKAEMKVMKKKGVSYLEIIGGEPTTRKDIVELIKFASELGFENISMATNGRRFAYYEFAEKIVEAGITDLIFSIHGHNDDLHDSLTRSEDSFNQLRKGIENIKKLGLERIGTNTTIVKQNYKHLEDIGNLILDLGVKNAEFIFVDPTYGAAKDDFESLVPKISEAAPYIKKCLDLGEGIRHWDVRYVPLCYFVDYLDHVSELKEVVNFETKHIAPDFYNPDVEGNRRDISRIKPKKCKDCKLYDKCEGIWKEYLKKNGDKELKPVI